MNTPSAGAFEYIVCKVPIASEAAYKNSPDEFAMTSCGTMPYTVAGGHLIREERTHCDEAYLRKVAYHTLIEWYHMMSFINDLYEEYHDQPIDAD